MVMQRRAPRPQAGFTLLELFVVAVIIVILVIVTLPRFFNVQDKVRESAVKINMRTLQIAAETYASDHGGQYPTLPPTGEKGDAFSSYFPGGSSGGDSPTPGRTPVNPFTNRARWSDFKSFSIASVAAERSKFPGSFAPGPIGAGWIGYANPSSVGQSAYAIEGVDKHGQALVDVVPTKTLVLSNQ